MELTVPVMVPIRVGQVEARGPIDGIEVAQVFGTAQLLVTVDGVPAGQVTVALAGGTATVEDIRSAIRDQLGSDVPAAAAPLATVTRPITVVVATRNRPDSLARCVRSVLRSAHPAVTVLVVDNDPSDDRSAAVVRDLADVRVTYIREDRRGTSNGRNRGLDEALLAGADLVAFTDDDVEVDPGWAGQMAAALAEPGVACVCGPVFGARLDTSAQVTADRALGWRKGYARRRFSLAQPPPDSAVFPFSPGMFGVGANTAVNAAVARELGGFDPALGPGTATHGGEDCEFMIRLVLAGHTLAYEPSAYVWHHHRPTIDELAVQMAGYALGLGGFVGKILLDPIGRSAALRRTPAALRQLWRIRTLGSAAAVPGSPRTSTLHALVAGPVAYVRARRQVRRAGGSVPPLT